jgi:hypothetical protein
MTGRRYHDPRPSFEDGWHDVATIRRMRAWDPTWAPPACAISMGWFAGNAWHRPHRADLPITCKR